MAEFVKKTALGGYKPVAGGPRDTECTHVILTLPGILTDILGIAIAAVMIVPTVLVNRRKELASE